MTFPSDIIFAAEFNDCVYESAYGILSLHHTEAGAEAAIKKHKAKILRQWKKVGHDKGPDYEQWRVRKIKVLE